LLSLLRVLAFASGIGPGFIPDIKTATKLGFSPRDMLSVYLLHTDEHYAL